MADELWMAFLSWLLDKSAGPFLGVLVAFGLNYLLEWWRHRRARQEYVKGFRREVVDAIASLRREKLELLRNDQWTAAVNSGDLKLFCSSQRAALSNAYFGISNFMYEAIRTRDMAEKYRSEPSEATKTAWSFSSNHAVQMGKSLLGTLENLQKQKWFEGA